VHALGYATPLPLIAKASETDVRELLRAHSNLEEFEELVVIDGDKMKARQRTLASLVVEDVLGPPDRFELSTALATALAPYVEGHDPTTHPTGADRG
jgi:hypothetical protein